jgi:CRP/FNR family cyclic AMP-dependent transcriptional regulator
MPTRTGPAREQLLSILQTAKYRLEYLTPNDWSLIIDRAKQLTFKKNEIVVQQGKQTKTVYLIAMGKVNVTVSGARLAQLGPGQVCGDMAFLENTLASATATAEEEVEAYSLEWQDLMDLFELFPHLASRFYRSLAVNLSRRLREQIMVKQGGKS